jgi:hypothetical protein
MSNYVWTLPGVAGVDYTVTAGGAATDNTVTLYYKTTGSKTVTVNYDNASGCTAATATSSTATTVNALPTVSTTDAASAIATTTATSGGNITATGGSAITQHGVVWNTATLPTIANSKTTQGAIGATTFTSNITGLSANTLYYVRAYATNGCGTTYGPEQTFVTLPAKVTGVASLGKTKNSINATWSDVTGSEAETYTVEYDEVPSVGALTINLISGISQNISGLDTYQDYTIRVKATNSQGDGAWSDPVTIKTNANWTKISITSPGYVLLADGAPNKNTSGYEDVRNLVMTQTSDIFNYDISYQYGLARVWSLSRGSNTKLLYYNTSAWSTLIHVNNGPGVGPLSVYPVSNFQTLTHSGFTISPFASTGTYYFRASVSEKYANSISDVFGNYACLTCGNPTGGGRYFDNIDLAFTLSDYDPPTVATTSVTGVTTTTATGTGDITATGTASVTERGFLFMSDSTGSGTVPETFANPFGTGPFTSSITGLTSNTEYRLAAYATNAGGTAYGALQTIITPPATPVTATIHVDASNATVSSAVQRGGGELLVRRGLCWNTSATPTVANDTTKDDVDFIEDTQLSTSTVSRKISGLQPLTTYYFRSYVENVSGLVYGNEVSFTTLAAPSADESSISLNYDHTPSWEDNNPNNADPSVPSGQTGPSNNPADGNFNGFDTWAFNNDAFQLPYNTDLGRLNYNSAKTVFVYFRPNDANTRQVLIELAGSNSGLNAYIYSGKVWVGIWNSSQRRYFSKSISANITNYLLNVEFNGTKVRTALNGECSSSMLFSGFSTNSNTNGIGGSINGTRYMDLTRSSGIYDKLNATVAEILMYNSCDQTLREDIMNFIDTKYGKTYSSSYTAYFGKDAVEAGWESYELAGDPFDKNENSNNSNFEVYQSAKNILINLFVNESENIELGIFDLNGIKVGTIHSGDIKSGENNFTYSTNDLISGVYFVRAIGATINESFKINIVK